MKKCGFILLIAVFGILLSGCNEPEDLSFGKITFNFSFVVDSVPVTLNELKYENAAGNKYMIEDIQLFLSRVKFIHSDQSEQVFNTAEFIHYLDFADNSTLSWTLPVKYDGGVYKGIGFTFGLNNEMNNSRLFKNAPESDMFWPEALGGGYHYMKLNCKWYDKASDNFLPLNFHLGRCPVYGEDGSNTPVTFVDYDFEVNFSEAFEVVEGKDNVFNIIVNINKWFDTPNVIDFSNYIGIAIMENQGIQVMAQQNGADVFTMEEVQ
ncbi:MAG: hypothetical protein PHR20_07040 [Bacteroidales bacterium]|nr:hypothetical protein [Bacteroidales bacterium]